MLLVTAAATGAVTCGSWVKLVSKTNGYRLHSHKITYGSGSGQQSVTATSNPTDSNSYWVVMDKYGHTCNPGEAINCGQTIRLKHENTNKYLHSHAKIQSPLSGNQEVSAHGMDAGDDWIVECKTGTWMREGHVFLRHAETGRYLSSSTSHMYSNVITGISFNTGQLEVSGAYYSRGTEWAAQDGIYIT
jgi:dolichyl-phosphate-mannose--protein O-mannosyl transferase